MLLKEKVNTEEKKVSTILLNFEADSYLGHEKTL